MTVRDLIRALDDYGDHVPVKVELEGGLGDLASGQYEFVLDSSTDDEDGTLIVVIRVMEQ